MLSRIASLHDFAQAKLESNPNPTIKIVTNADAGFSLIHTGCTGMDEPIIRTCMNIYYSRGSTGMHAHLERSRPDPQSPPDRSRRIVEDVLLRMDVSSETVQAAIVGLCACDAQQQMDLQQLWRNAETKPVGAAVEALEVDVAIMAMEM